MGEGERKEKKKTYSHMVQVVPESGPRELITSLKPFPRLSGRERV